MSSYSRFEDIEVLVPRNSVTILRKKFEDGPEKLKNGF